MKVTNDKMNASSEHKNTASFWKALLSLDLENEWNLSRSNDKRNNSKRNVQKKVTHKDFEVRREMGLPPVLSI